MDTFAAVLIANTVAPYTAQGTRQFLGCGGRCEKRIYSQGNIPLSSQCLVTVPRYKYLLRTLAARAQFRFLPATLPALNQVMMRTTHLHQALVRTVDGVRKSESLAFVDYE